MRYDLLTVRLNLGALAVLLGMAGLGIFRWEWLLIGWGSTTFALALLELFSDLVADDPDLDAFCKGPNR